MGILCIVGSVLFGVVGFMQVMTAQAVTAELFGAELLICSAVFFGAGSICNELTKSRDALDPSKAKADKPSA